MSAHDRARGSNADHLLVTGAAGAIGGALAIRLRRAQAAAHITLVDIDQPGLELIARTIGDPVSTQVIDLSRPEDLDDAWPTWTEDPGPVHTLINCAGIMEVRSLEGTGWALGRRILNIDLVTPMRLLDLAVPAMQRAGRGRIVNIASMAGTVPLRGMSYYSAAKAGLAMASEIARLELEPHGIRVLTVYPGPIESPLERHARSGYSADSWAQHVRPGDPDGLADAILAGLDRGTARVIYPKFYALAARVPTIARWFAARFSPSPAA